MIFSAKFLPLKKPNWMGEMGVGSIEASLRQISFEMTLLVKLLRIIGLNSKSFVFRMGYFWEKDKQV